MGLEFFSQKAVGTLSLYYHYILSLHTLSLYSQITFVNEVGRYELEVTTFQMAVLFAWNQRPKDKLSYESLKLATELPDIELRKTILVGV